MRLLGVILLGSGLLLSCGEPGGRLALEPDDVETLAVERSPQDAAVIPPGGTGA